MRGVEGEHIRLRGLHQSERLDSHRKLAQAGKLRRIDTESARHAVRDDRAGDHCQQQESGDHGVLPEIVVSNSSAGNSARVPSIASHSSDRGSWPSL